MNRKLVLGVAVTLSLLLGILFQAAIPSSAFQSPPPPPGPANDNFANATVITTLPFDDTVDSATATVEPGEPQNCVYSNNTIWYSFTPAQDMLLHVDMAGGQYESNLTIYWAYGPGIGGLNYVSCSAWNPAIDFQAQAGVTYYFQAGSFNWPGTLQIHVRQWPPPDNDNFAGAKAISSLPFSDYIYNTIAATTEAGELPPSCAGSIYRTVWYAYTPTTSGSLTISADSYYNKVVAVYTGSNLGSLKQIGCRSYWGSGRLTFSGEATKTYFIQVGSYNPGESGWLNFSLDVAPPPQANFWFSPGDPTTFEAVQFYDNAWDPAEVGIKSVAWDLGDGSTSTDWNPTHQYARDGDYTVKFTVTTFDGRTASSTQTVTVRTHDVAIVKLTAPNAASVGQTRAIIVEVKNVRYPERVNVQLYKSVPGGEEWVAATIQNIPVRSGNRTTSVNLGYTFGAGDAAMGKVTFRATAWIADARDALPADNQAISSPTKVSK